jgi:hypothetical protein
MTSSKRVLCVRVFADEIVISLPGSHYAITYCKHESSEQLDAKHIPGSDDLLIPVTVAEFLAKASKLAHEKATELGWFRNCQEPSP